jgi:hypothetical protein
MSATEQTLSFEKNGVIRLRILQRIDYMSEFRDGLFEVLLFHDFYALRFGTRQLLH